MKRKKLSLLELNRPSLKEYARIKKHDLIVVADNIRSAMNIGSIKYGTKRTFTVISSVFKVYRTVQIQI